MADDDIETAVDTAWGVPRGGIPYPPKECAHKMVRLELSAPLSLYAPTDVLADTSRQFVHDSFSVMVDMYLETTAVCRGSAQCTECEAELEWDSQEVTQALANAAKIAHKHMAWELVG